MMGSIFNKNQNYNTITKFRSYHTALQNLGQFVFVRVCWGFFLSPLKGERIHAEKKARKKFFNN